MKTRKFILELIETIGVSIAVIFLIYAFVASVELISGSSMEPNFHTGERILVDKVSKHFKEFERGQVVVINPPGGNEHFIKRIIALPNDVVKFYDCSVYVVTDGRRYKLEEGYLYPEMCTVAGSYFSEGKSYALKDNEYLVLGDNRQVSVDGRTFGLIPKKNILGNVIFRFWPISSAGFLN